MKNILVIIILFVTSYSSSEQVSLDTLKGPANKSFQISNKWHNVAFSQIITNPGQYDKKVIRLIGYLHLVFEGSAIYPHAEDVVEFPLVSDSTNIPYGLIYNYRVGVYFTKKIRNKIESEKLNDNYVIIEGKFNIMRNSWDRSVGCMRIAQIKAWTSDDL